jgi:hypothetical protein
MCRQRNDLASYPRAVVTDYDGLVSALRQRAQALDSPLDIIDEVASLPARYTAKLKWDPATLGRAKSPNQLANGEFSLRIRESVTARKTHEPHRCRTAV